MNSLTESLEVHALIRPQFLLQEKHDKKWMSCFYIDTMVCHGLTLFLNQINIVWLKAHLDGLDFCPTFTSTNLSNKCWVHLNRSATLSKALKKVENLSNGSQIISELDQSFAQLP